MPRSSITSLLIRRKLRPCRVHDKLQLDELSLVNLELNQGIVVQLWITGMTAGKGHLGRAGEYSGSAPSNLLGAFPPWIHWYSSIMSMISATGLNPHGNAGVLPVPRALAFLLSWTLSVPSHALTSSALLLRGRATALDGGGSRLHWRDDRRLAAMDPRIRRSGRNTVFPRPYFAPFRCPVAGFRRGLGAIDRASSSRQ